MQRDGRPLRWRFVTVVVLVTMLAGAGVGHGVLASAAPPPDTATVAAPAAAGAPVVSDNPFIPENANLGDCISSVPRPGCGSEARGGWRQALVFAVVLVALVVIGARIAVAVRRRDRPST